MSKEVNNDEKNQEGEGGVAGGTAGGAGSLNTPFSQTGRRTTKQQPALLSEPSSEGEFASLPQEFESEQTPSEDPPSTYQSPEESPFSSKRWSLLSQDNLFILMMIFLGLGIVAALLAGLTFAAPAVTAIIIGLSIAAAPLIAIGAVKFFIAVGKAIYNAGVAFVNAVTRFGKAVIELGRKLVSMAVSFALFCRDNFFSLFGLVGLTAFILAAFFLAPFLVPFIGIAAAPIVAFVIGGVALLMLLGLGFYLRNRFTNLSMPFSEKLLLALAISVPIGLGLMLFAPALGLVLFPGLAAGAGVILMGALVCAVPFMLLLLGWGLKSLNKAKGPLSVGMVVGTLLVISVGTLAILSALGIVTASLPLIIALFGIGVACCLPYLLYNLFSGKPPWSERTTRQKILFLLAIGAIAAVGVFAIGMAVGLALPGIAGIGGVLLLSAGALLAPLLLYGSLVAIQRAINYVIDFVRKNPRLVVGAIGVTMMVSALVLAFVFPPLALPMLLMGIAGAVLVIGAAFDKIWQQMVRLGLWIQRNAVPVFAVLALAVMGVALIFLPVGVALVAFALPALFLLGVGFLIAKKPLSLRDKIILGLVGSAIIGLAMAGLLLLFAPGLALLPLIAIAAGVGFLPLLAYGIYQIAQFTQRNAVYIFGTVAVVGTGVTIALITTGVLAVAPFVLPLVIIGGLVTLGLGLGIRLLSDVPLTKKEKAFLTLAATLLVGVLGILTGGLILGLGLGLVALVACSAASMRETLAKNPIMSTVAGLIMSAALFGILSFFMPFGFPILAMTAIPFLVVAGAAMLFSGPEADAPALATAATVSAIASAPDLAEMEAGDAERLAAQQQAELTGELVSPSYAEAPAPQAGLGGSAPAYAQTIQPLANAAMLASQVGLTDELPPTYPDAEVTEMDLPTEPAPERVGVDQDTVQKDMEADAKEQGWDVVEPQPVPLPPSVFNPQAGPKPNLLLFVAEQKGQTLKAESPMSRGIRELCQWVKGGFKNQQAKRDEEERLARQAQVAAAARAALEQQQGEGPGQAPSPQSI